jgi:hypothetical protein
MNKIEKQRRKADLRDGAITILGGMIGLTVLALLVSFLCTSCGSTQSVCPAYKVKAKTERTKVTSRASDPKPLRKAYVMVPNGAR